MAWCIKASEIGTTISSVKMPSAACSVTAAERTDRAGDDGPSFHRARRIDGVNERDEPDRISQHAVVELHRERIFEEIAP